MHAYEEWEKMRAAAYASSMHRVINGNWLRKRCRRIGERQAGKESCSMKETLARSRADVA